ncbi:response regulator transcription factor [Pseudoflavitalea sp. X16]|uniref:LytR/AlgR family response regulator transcription factor n=1 Tax=Paraflavitalea devenefica TaxID=2716334 RepID=UPI00141EBA97|nr:LytTR family DNA-binding domain-containing protein [Paraflavitalea devenefica]NII24732.1 response regulator transcription factor [Paraflavitalea devenefica]
MSTLYRCLVVEDEPLAQNVLKKYIGEHPLLELAAVCSDAVEAQQWLARQQAAIVFLDINLPRLSGISFLKSLSRPPLVIFTTAYPEFAAEGFELDAIDYLVKPFSFERFLKAVNKALEKLERKESGSALAATSIFIKADKKVYKVNLADILYIEALDDYVKVVTTQGHYLVHDTLKSLQEELPAEQFMRVHKSYIIASNKIVFIEGNYVKIGEKDIPIGASYREAVFARLKI